jgi:hypothetical protein
MSCFLCGKHRPRSQLMSKKLLGKSQSVCAPSCKEAEAAAKAGGLVRPATAAGVSTPAAADAGGGK